MDYETSLLPNVFPYICITRVKLYMFIELYMLTMYYMGIATCVIQLYILTMYYMGITGYVIQLHILLMYE